MRSSFVVLGLIVGVALCGVDSVEAKTTIRDKDICEKRGQIWLNNRCTSQKRPPCPKGKFCPVIDSTPVQTKIR